MRLRRLIPRRVRAALLSIYYRYGGEPTKHDNELSFWKNCWEHNNGKFTTGSSYYQKVMLAMAEEGDQGFLEGKVVADFGCGPCGSLTWVNGALVRIGIDVLADRYADHFKPSLISHGMVYVKCTETVIPLPSDYVDVLITVNAMDHVDDFESICNEILRIIKPGGELIGSFNLEEAPSPCEPQRLTEEIIASKLLNYLQVLSYRTASCGPDNDPYRHFFAGELYYERGQKGFLWVRARKPK